MKHDNSTQISTDQFDIFDINIAKNLTEKEIQKIDEGIDKKKNNKTNQEQINVFVTKDKRKIKPLNEFVILFISSFRQIIEKYNLTGKEIKILLCLIEKMKIGNQLVISQIGIAKELNEKQPNISRAFKKFFECGLLVKDEFGNIFINSQIITKQNLEQTQKSDVNTLSTKKLKELGVSINY